MGRKKIVIPGIGEGRIGTFDQESQTWVGGATPKSPIWDNDTRKWILVKGWDMECQRCGKKFESMTLNRRYCGDECRKQAYIDERKRHSRKPTEPRCLNCGGLISDKRAKAKFCGHTCTVAYHRKQNKG